MQRLLSAIYIGLALALQSTFAQTPAPAGAAAPGPAPAPGGARQGRGAAAAPVQAKPEDLAKIKDKTLQIEALLKDLKAKGAQPELVVDVEAYAHAGLMLLEFPELMATQAAIDHAFTTLDQGIGRGQQLAAGQPQWNQGKKQILAYTSEIDGAVLPYGVTLPDNYDPTKPVRLYVSLHGRQNNTTESEFITGFLGRRGTGGVADQGQIQIDCFGRVNGAGWHWAGEADIFEAIAAVEKRFKIDDKRIMLRGFSMGGEGAWHIALHYPDRFAAAEVGAGTWSRRAETPGFQPYQYATLKIWENMPDWALNIYNLPLAGHDGDSDTQIPSLPGPPPGAPNRGQLESSLRTRAQLEREGFPSAGEPDFLRATGVPGIFLISQNTGHGTSPLVRQRLDAFLKEWGDKGQVSPDHLRFLTYTTRYNRDYWASLDGLEKHYERAEIDAQRTEGGTAYDIKTKNLTRLVLRETDHAREIKIDGQTLAVKAAPEITLDRDGGAWTVAKNGPASGLRKTHALQGPIDDAFLDPFLLVRPTGQPWNDAVNQQALRTMAHFDLMWAKYFRGHPFVKDDKDVTEADFAKYHVVLFGDPGSNQWIAKLNGQLPFTWTRQNVTLGGRTYAANENYPAMIYPNPLNPAKYVVLNTGLTIEDRGYNGDYGMPMWGDYAIVRAKAGTPAPDLVTGGLFDEHWQLPK
jgi:pimeloyl-ACP methyl ester carboxylesterase